MVVETEQRTKTAVIFFCISQALQLSCPHQHVGSLSWGRKRKLEEEKLEIFKEPQRNEARQPRNRGGVLRLRKEDMELV